MAGELHRGSSCYREQEGDGREAMVGLMDWTSAVVSAVAAPLPSEIIPDVCDV